MAAEAGPSAISLRELARRAGVSHSAPVHHFGTLRGLLTALAASGFEELTQSLTATEGNIYNMGSAYVLWALDHPGHYAVMWQPRLLDDSDPDLSHWRQEAWRELATAATAASRAPAEDKESRVSAYAAFAVVHGLADIWLSGALPVPDDAAGVVSEVTRRLRFDLDGPRR